MRAIVATRYGGPEVLELRERPIPTPGPRDALVRVHAAGINPADLHLLRGEPAVLRLGSGWRRPRRDVPGADVAGRVEAVGAEVTALRPGDAVFADLSRAGRGAFAAYALAPAAAWTRMPPGLAFEAAAATPMAAVTALQGLRDHGTLAPGQRVLVNGASGGVGSFAVQLARAMGARVTGVSSSRNLALVASLGAERALDYAVRDFTREGRTYDLVFDAAGNRTVADLRRALAPSGVLVSTAFLPGLLLAGMRPGPRRLRAMLARPDPDDLAHVAGLLALGAIAPVLDRTYALEQAPDALAYVAQRHARGKVVLRVDDDRESIAAEARAGTPCRMGPVPDHAREPGGDEAAPSRGKLRDRST